MGTVLLVGAIWLFLLALAMGILRTAGRAERDAERRLQERRCIDVVVLRHETLRPKCRRRTGATDAECFHTLAIDTHHDPVDAVRFFDRRSSRVRTRSRMVW